ncbi:P-loop containing nucleoside triphosphate hydrolase protein [Microdochium bolleyi]|uniref:Kinesin-like protein n=1 Tax=Microdochium bolleyi TaxID=196109 RepID=A0A136J6U9_9PEZI|nr:P-loop containing nucleoside triphosphate hydrolase protein [Microdochium bolleyi]
MDSDGVTMRPTGLRQPRPISRHQFSASTSNVTSALHEISDSQSNARSQIAQPALGSKRVLQPVVQPEAKRQTLADRAGYPGRPPTSSVQGSRSVKGIALKDVAKTSSGLGSYSNLPASRAMPTTSYSSSTSIYGASSGRPPSRSQHARSRSNTKTIQLAPASRPVTSMGNREREEPTGPHATDIDERLGKFDSDLAKMKEFMDSSAVNTDRLVEELDAAKRRAGQLEAKKVELQDDLDEARRGFKNASREVQFLTDDVEKMKQKHQDECDHMRRRFDRELEEQQRQLAIEQEKHNDLLRQFEEKCGRDAEAQKEQLEKEILEQRARVTSLRHEKDLEVQKLNFHVQERELQLRKAEDDLGKARDQVDDHERSIARLTAKIEQLEENAKSLQETYGSSENRKDHQISDLSRQLQELTRRAEAAERAAEEEKKAAKRLIEASNEDFERMTAQVKAKLLREEEKRHKLFEQVQDLKGNIRVMCRIRPAGASPDLLDFDYFESEYDEDKYGGLVVPTERENALEEGKKVLGKSQPFNFERIFDPSCTNQDVFDEISQLVQSVMDGKKVCIFCYGQTGSGKTYTMSNQNSGPDGSSDQGIIPRAKQMIFDEVTRMRDLGWEYSLEGSYLEVYKNKLYDLVAPRSAEPRPLQIIRTSDELEIRDHEFVGLESEDDLDYLVQQAETNRHTAETNMNRASSRSHSVLVIKVHGRKTMPDGKIKVREGTLNLIDLAGSESIGRSGATGDVAEEGRQINMSLTHLGTVLKKLGEGVKKESVDFSSFTLTQLLKPSLGEKCRTLMFCMVSPLKDNAKETINSLKFAENAQKVKQAGGTKGSGGKRLR